MSTDAPSQRSSLLASGTVIAALISGVTALVTALLPWLLPANDPTAPTTDLSVLAARDDSSTSVHAPNLTLGAWTIVASVDEAGTDFSGSTLKFVSQHEVAGRVEATGFFEWRSAYDLIGREQVTAIYDPATRQLFIEGKYTDNPDVLATGSFSAEVSEDGRQLLHGTWGSVPGNRTAVLGTWEARR